MAGGTKARDRGKLRACQHALQPQQSIFITQVANFMPFSESSMLSAIVGFLEARQPKSILDVGIGFGQYGFLARTNLEHLNLFEWDDHGARKRTREEWLIKIDGIEAFPDYITPVSEYCYNTIYKGDALDVLPTITDKYEMILAIEILEHFSKEDGLRFLELLKGLASKSVLISTPKIFIEQNYPANPYENHRSFWTQEELRGLGFSEFLDNPDCWIASFSHDPG